MIDKLRKTEDRFKFLESEMSSPETISNQDKMRALSREHSQLRPVIEYFHKYLKMTQELDDTSALLSAEKDNEMLAMLHDEKDRLKSEIQILENELMIMLLPKDPNSGRNIIVEIRAGTGGDEAALFGADLFRMYSRYADIKGYKIEMLEYSQNEIGGIKEVIFLLAGEDVYDNLKFESGGHRVQRVPTTESGGRIHTSAVTVAVMPEAEDTDVVVRNEDLRVDVYRSSGHGGQSVNTTDSAVRITHIPTGMVVTCQDEKSQLKNKTKALKVLKARLFEIEENKRHEVESKLRKSLVGSGDRSGRIRTYNFPQSRITDHRIGLTLYSLEAVLNGELDQVVKPLIQHEIEELLKTHVV